MGCIMIAWFMRGSQQEIRTGSVSTYRDSISKIDE